MNDLPGVAEANDHNFRIEFFFDGVAPGCLSESERTKLRQAVIATLRHAEVVAAEVSIAVVCSDRMQQLNNQYLQHDYDTDVLSFCLGTEEELGFLLGQLIVSLDYAQRQCEELTRTHEFPVPLLHELALYLVHGSLHLVGYDDHEPAEREEMRQMEHQVLLPLGMPPVWTSER
ncbi:MAG: rRNA maturation RNase YbeY [Planctomycetaceae bacterium]|nr:rRNA maturation RNase YbeY [Planctomycetaceae bacterium]